MPATLRRRLLPRLLLVAASLGLSLLAGELAVRLARPQEAMTVERGLYEPDPPRRYRLHPGYRVSQQGSSRCWINLRHSFKVSFVTLWM